MKEYRGMRTFRPHEYRHLNRIITGWKDAAFAFGFMEYRTPLLDPAELYGGKTSEEIMNEQVYAFTDRGDREVVLRPEITPGVSTMIAGMQRDRVLRTPCKVFSVGSVFRYEKPQKGRTREHIQFNADIFGESDAWADAEVMTMLFDSLERMGCPADACEVRISDRAATETVLAENGVREREMPHVLRLLDKREKITPEVFQKELATLSPALLYISDAADITALFDTEPERVREVRSLLPENIPARYDPSVIRGFDYYTGIVFEVFVRDTDGGRSVAGGGRYDALIESYGGTPLPAVGFGMGDVVLADLLKERNIPIPDGAVATVVCALTPERSAEAYAACGVLRKDVRRHGRRYPVSFIGTVPEKKLGDEFKRRHADGILFGMYIDAEGRWHLRNFATRRSSDDRAAFVREITETAADRTADTHAV